MKSPSELLQFLKNFIWKVSLKCIKCFWINWHPVICGLSSLRPRKESKAGHFKDGFHKTSFMWLNNVVKEPLSVLLWIVCPIKGTTQYRTEMPASPQQFYRLLKQQTDHVAQSLRQDTLPRERPLATFLPANSHGNDDWFPARVQHLPGCWILLGNDDPKGQQGNKESTHQWIHIGFLLWVGKRNQRSKNHHRRVKDSSLWQDNHHIAVSLTEEGSLFCHA